MPLLKEITTDDFKGLLKDFFAEPSERHKMTEEEIRDLAQRLNEKINVPIIDENREEQIFIKIILKIDTFLYDHLPNEFYDVNELHRCKQTGYRRGISSSIRCKQRGTNPIEIRSSDRGIDVKEAKRLVRRLAKTANDKIDIPYLPEFAEQIAIKFVIGMVVKAARKKLNFEKVRAESSKLVIPDSNDDLDSLVD